MPTFFIPIIIIFIVIAIIGGIFGHRQQQQRIAALTALTEELGWRFTPQKNPQHRHEFSQFSIFNRGESRYAYNTLHGTIEIDGAAWPAQMGDYHYVTESTNNSNNSRTRTTHRFSYLIVTTPYASVPSLTIRREHFFDRMAAFVGFDDIDFESAEFSKRFHVKSSDKRFAYDVIHPRMMEFLMDSEPPKIDLQQSCGCVSDDGKCWSPEKFRRQVTWIQEFFSHWPRHVTAEL